MKPVDEYAAYERGWVDSLRGFFNQSAQPLEEVFAWAQGWHACAKYRWEDPKGKGIAPDPLFRIPRQ